MNNMEITNNTNHIHIDDIIMRDGKAGELFREIIGANENCASIDEILALEKELDELKSTKPDYEYISMMIEALTEARENAEQYTLFEEVREATLKDTGNEDLAEDFAYELVYGE